MYSVHWVLLTCIFSLSSSSTCNLANNVGEYLCEAPTINLMQNGSETVLYTRLCEWSVKNGSDIIVQMTRYCYCQLPESVDPNDASCSVPGPTLLMHDYTNINVTVISELEGSQIVYNQSSKYWNQYKDMDITNLHVHGLHVSPFVDDVLVKIHPHQSHSYLYDIGYHYPGTFWYHAHHHGSTTWQVNMGLHGTILMNQDNDTISTKYKENVLMFEWFYIVPRDVCINPENNGCSPDGSSDTPNYHRRFSTSLRDTSSGFLSNVTDNYAMCDVYCSFPPEQRAVSGYRYDVITNLSYSESDFNSKDGKQRLMYFFTNGQLSPTIKMTTGEFRRLRMVNSFSNFYLQFQFPYECEWYLIATDGIYIGGRFQNYDLSQESHNNQYLMSPGGRADIMVKCRQSGVYKIISTNSTSQDPLLQNFTERIYNGRILFSLEVSDPDTPIIDGTDQLPDNKSVPVKPANTYIEDLSTLKSPETNCPCNYNDPQNTECQFTLKFSGGGTVNDKPFGISNENQYENDALTLINLNESYEFIINNNGNWNGTAGFSVSHVYHQHINPFQVQTNIGKNGFIALNTTWWDTLGNLPQNENERIRMRFWTRDYYGLIILHCHLLQHEDSGMMGFYGIQQNIPQMCPNQQQQQSTDIVLNTSTTTTPITSRRKMISTKYYTTKDDDTGNTVRYKSVYVVIVFLLYIL